VFSPEAILNVRRNAPISPFFPPLVDFELANRRSHASTGGCYIPYSVEGTPAFYDYIKERFWKFSFKRLRGRNRWDKSGRELSLYQKRCSDVIRLKDSTLVLLMVMMFSDLLYIHQFRILSCMLCSIVK
jgi:hypothetical protein